MAAQEELFAAPADERLERVARALWGRDARRSFGKPQSGDDPAERLWARVRKHYIDEATVCLEAADA